MPQCGPSHFPYIIFHLSLVICHQSRPQEQTAIQVKNGK